MDFRFNLNEIFREPVVEIGNTLVPPKFTGDKRALWDTQSKVSQIVNAMGEASAAAQGLSKPITTADRLRNSEHKLYLLIDHSANNGRGSVTGMLKTGQKGLYVFDREGQHYQVSPPCILDFYVHESKQRSGYGRRLFEHMLFREQVEPVKMAIDRPSEKLLGFLNKHYGLHSPVKQMNNYVVFDGFFPRAGDHPRTPVDTDQSSPTKKQSANGLQHGGFPTSPYGRYGARKPPCSMNQIIHNDSAVIKRNQEPTGVRSEPFTNLQAQQNYQYRMQNPWQTTQSVPNMPIMQNQQQFCYGQNMPQNYVMAQGDAPPNPPPNYYYPPQQYYNQPTVPTSATSGKTREPILPQSFDGTVRKAPHVAQSLPMNSMQPSQPVLIHSTPSAPLSYQMYNNAPMQQYGQNLVTEIPPQRFMQQEPAYKQVQPQEQAQGYQMNQNVNSQQLEHQNQVPNEQILHNSVVQGQVQVQPSQQYNELAQRTVASPQNYSYSQSQQQQQQTSSTSPNVITPQIKEEMPAQNQLSSPELMLNSSQANQEPLQQQENLQSNQMAVTQQIQQQNYVQNTSSSMAMPTNNHQTSNPQPSPCLPTNNQQNAPQETQNVPQKLPEQNQPSAVISSQEIPSSGHHLYHQMVQQGSEVHPVQQNIVSGGYLNNPVGGQGVDNMAGMMQQKQSVPNVCSSTAEYDGSCQPPVPKQYDLSKGYPPQLQQSAPKADRPNSLNIEHPENGEPEANGHAVEVPPPSDDQPEEEEELTKLEQQVEKIEIEQEKVDTPLSGRVQGSPEAAGLSTRGANTPEQAPGLTDQGYFDLKFYHNKLW